MDNYPVPADDPSLPAGPGPVTAAEAIGAVDAAMRMGIRAHPMVPAVILSNFVVQAFDIAVAINNGRRHGDLDRALIRTLARDLDRDLDPSRAYFQVRQLSPGLAVSRELLSIRALDQMPERHLAYTVVRCFVTAVRIVGKFRYSVESTLARYLDLRLDASRDHDLELACELADRLDSDLELVLELAHELYELNETRGQIRNVNGTRGQIFYVDRSISRALSLAFERSHALNRVCALSVAGRLGLESTEGLAEALLDGALDDFTTADLTHAILAEADLTGVRWSLSGTTWPPEIQIKTLLARSQEVEPGVFVVVRRGMFWRPVMLAADRPRHSLVALNG